MRLVLGSASPRRAELLAAAGYAFDVHVAEVDERVRPDEGAREYVCRLAAEKAAAVLRILEGPAEAGPHDSRSGLRDVLIIGADTAVVVDDEILGKPLDDADAARMLRRLSGRAHLVLTGMSLRCCEREVSVVEETRVFVQPLSTAEIDWYLRSGEGRDKAGAYAIQGLASRFIPRIEGSYANVVGLPVARIPELLRQLP